MKSQQIIFILKIISYLKKDINANNKYLELIYQMFKDYMFLTKVTVNQLMININFY